MENKARTIPRKNYILAGIICVLTIIIASYLAFWYKSNKEYNENNSIMTGYLLEIGEDEVILNLTNYVLDNPNTILYMSYGNDATVKDFEKEFKNVINEYNIKASFIYIDLNMISNKKFSSELKDTFFSEELINKGIEVLKQPNLFIFEDGKIIDVLYSAKQQINIDDIKRYLTSKEVINND